MIGTNHVSRMDTILVPSCGDLLPKNLVLDVHGCCIHLMDRLPCVEVTTRAGDPSRSFHAHNQLPADVAWLRLAWRMISRIPGGMAGGLGVDVERNGATTGALPEKAKVRASME